MLPHKEIMDVLNPIIAIGKKKTKEKPLFIVA
jgi:hypothetical protein